MVVWMTTEIPQLLVDKVVDFPVVQVCSFLVPRSSPTSAVACAWLVLLVTIQFALCSLLSWTSPMCSASWTVWLRRTVLSRHRGRTRRRHRQVHVHSWFCCADAYRAVFPSIGGRPKVLYT